MFKDWDRVQDMLPIEAGEFIFEKFKTSRQPDEMESLALYGEHMVEVGQYLKRKLADRAEKCGRKPGNIANSKFWYEVRKKVAEVLEHEKTLGIKRDITVGSSEDINNCTEEADSEV